MKTKLAKLGNSQGLRLSTQILRELGFFVGQDLEMTLNPGQLIVTPLENDRTKWSFPGGKEEKVLGDDIVSFFDEDEWTW